MIKKMQVLIFFLLCLCSCHLPTQVENRTDTELEYSELELTKHFVEIGETIIYSNFEVSFTDSYIAKKANSSDLQVKTSLSEMEDSVYFIVLGTVKNIGSSTASFTDLFSPTLIFDSKYEYEVSLSPWDVDDIAPLKVENFVMYASASTEILDLCEDYEFQLNINDSENNENNEFFVLAGQTNRYGSLENIRNFNTFAETIQAVVGLHSGFDMRIYEDDKYVIVEPYSDWDFQIPDSGYYSLTPRLYLRYDFFDSKYIEYGEMRLYVNTYFTSAIPDSMTVKSDFGSFSCEHRVWPPLFSTSNDDWMMYLCGNEDISYDHQWAVLNGNNVSISIGYTKYESHGSIFNGTYQGENVEKEQTHTIPNDWGSKYQELFQIYSECPASLEMNLD